MAYDEELAERLREVLAREKGLTEKRMFGGLAFLIGGHMAVAASGRGGLLLRCDPASTESLVNEPGAAPFVMRGKEMVGWLYVATDAVTDDADLRRWVRHGVDYARGLPPKAG
jgi:TfoX/Sxy family transcriptional regulator of competence genes